MSDPTYRIDATHRPWDPQSIRWCANVTRLSDDALMFSAFGVHMTEAIRNAQDWIKAESVREPGVTLFVGDNGELVGEQMSTDFPGQPFGPGDTISHSVKA